MQGRVQQSLRALQAGGWEGRGAAAFFGEMNGTVLPSLGRLGAALQQSQEATRQIVQVLRAAEEEASQPFRGAGEGGENAQDGGGFWGGVGDFFRGAGAELKDMVTGLWNMVTDPVGTAKGLWFGITHPGQLWDAITQPYVEAWESGHPWKAIGRGTVAVVTTLLGTKGADKVSKLLKGATVADDVARVGAVADDVARAGSVADDAVRMSSVMDDTARVGSVMDDAVQKTIFQADNIIQKTGDSLIHDVESLHQASQLSGKNNFTKAGHALQKHANRPGDIWSPYLPKGSLNPSNYNAVASKLVRDILTDPDTIRSFHKEFIHYYASDGRGLRFLHNGDFIGFINP